MKTVPEMIHFYDKTFNTFMIKLLSWMPTDWINYSDSSKLLSGSSSAFNEFTVVSVKYVLERLPKEVHN